MYFENFWSAMIPCVALIGAPVVSQPQVSVEVFSELSIELGNRLMEFLVIIRQDILFVLVNALDVLI